MADDFNPGELARIMKMERMHTLHPRKDPWTAIGWRGSYTIRDEEGVLRRVHYSNIDLWNEWTNYKSYGQRKGQPKPPETWLTRRKASGERRYTNVPKSGFSGALGAATTQKKKLLGA